MLHTLTTLILSEVSSALLGALVGYELYWSLVEYELTVLQVQVILRLTVSQSVSQ
jgi:hypothetical protein